MGLVLSIMILKGKKTWKIQVCPRLNSMRCKLTKRHEVSACPKLGTGIGKRCFKVRAARAVWYCLHCCHCQRKSSFKETCTPFFRLFSLPLYPYPLMSRNARNDEVGEIVKTANNLCIALLGILTISPTSPATNKSMQITTREGPLCECPIWRI